MALHKIAATVGVSLFLGVAEIQAAQNVVFHTEVIANDGVRSEADQVLPPNRKLTTCVGFLRTRTPLELNAGGKEHLIDGAFCDGLVVQAQLIEGRQNGALVDWQVGTYGRSPMDNKLSVHEYLRFDKPFGLASAKCTQLDVASIKFSIRPEDHGRN